MSSKACFKCGHEKPLSAFYVHPQMKDGRLNKCIECTKRDVRTNRAANLDYYREYDRSRANEPSRVQARREYMLTDAFRVSHAAALLRNYKKDPYKYAARRILRRALFSGKVSAMPCLICGAKAEAHHPDYSRPLDVVWLCSAHHAETHRMARAILRKAT